MYSRSEYRRMAETKARVAEQLALAHASAEARRIRAENPGSVSLEINTTSPALDVPNTPAVPPSVKFAKGHTTESINKKTNQSKMAVYNDPIDGSSSKRKANGHDDAPAPKKANTSTWVPRAPGQRYQGTARQAPESRPSTILKTKSVTQQKARRNDAMELDVHSTLGRKRGAENNLNESATKKQKLNAHPSSNAPLSSNPVLAQSSKAGQAMPEAPSSAEAASTANFFDSLYPKDSKVKASAGRAVHTTEIVRTVVPPTAVQTRRVVQTAPTKATPAVKKPKSPTPPKSHKKDGKGPVAKNTAVIKTSRNEELGKLPTSGATPQRGIGPKETTASRKGISRTRIQTGFDYESPSAEQVAKAAPLPKSDGELIENGLEKQSVKVSRQIPPVSHKGHNASTEGTEKSLKRKKDTTFEEGNTHKKLREGDGSATHGKEHARGKAEPSVKEIAEPESTPVAKVRRNQTQKLQSHARKAGNSVDNSKTETTHQNSGKKSPSAGISDHTSSANRTLAKEGKKTSSNKDKNTESRKDAKPSVVGYANPNAKKEDSEARGAEPRGIYNGAMACYINSVLQAIANIPRMADHYRGLANQVIPEIAEYVALNAANWQGGDNKNKYKSKAKGKLRVLLERNKSKICLGAYLGVLLNEMLDPDPLAEAPSSYVFRQACGVLLANDKGERYDGEDQQECMEYFEKLLDHLDIEEVDGRTENFEAPSLVQELFGLEAITKIQCRSCGHAWDSCVEKKFAFTTSMPSTKNLPDRESRVCITECLDAYSIPDSVDVHCNGCGETSRASKWMQLKDLSPYVLVNLNRVVVHGSENQMEATFTRNPDTVSLPLSEGVTMKDGVEDVQYEAIGTIKHRGIDFSGGHWTSWMKIDGQWWCFDDDHVAKKESKRGHPVTCMVVLKRSA
ncbi:hypothetical protein HO133_008341 [Letharia lupina]|uniref:USP domain-containing protein n=1 Tax=Letharia lupina TaxID=560253 RepID=A0A8H6CNZ9_9LECA|nr:uncharacterized protein HO133_008341 [Letharia lupina]KAF6226900.1 hypothetical protein HO133_008341 [Letharia lupina]